MSTRDALRKQMEEDGIEYLLVQFVDITGAAKVKMVPVNSFDDAIDDGAGFAGGAVWGVGQGPHSHDMLARIDLDTYSPIAWKPNTARFAADLFVDGEPHPYCPRTNFKRVLAGARDRGYIFNVGMEPEHFLVVRGEDGELRVWDPDAVDSLTKPCYDFRSMAPAMGVPPGAYRRAESARLGGSISATTKMANGQFEVNFDYTDALTTADRIVFFRMAASQLAHKYGAIATFMPKPFGDRTGSGLHAPLPPGRCQQRERRVSRRQRRTGGSAAPSWLTISSAASCTTHAPCARSRVPPSTATSVYRSDPDSSRVGPGIPGPRLSSPTATTTAPR